MNDREHGVGLELGGLWLPARSPVLSEYVPPDGALSRGGPIT
jgi:hypothetical protein